MGPLQRSSQAAGQKHRRIPVQLDGKEVVGMAYIMDLEMDHGLPSLAYYQTVQEGYEDCGLDVSVLERAVLDSAKPYFAEGIRQSYQQSLFSEGDSGEEFEGEEEDMDEPDLSGSFGFSDGIRL